MTPPKLVLARQIAFQPVVDLARALVEQEEAAPHQN
jgi:hypothetical protein